MALFTEKPPHTHSTIPWPTYGSAERRFVITVAPQKDICPQGKTYPKKAVIIDNKKIIMPDTHVSCKIKELKYRLRPICKYMAKKNKEAPFA